MSPTLRTKNFLVRADRTRRGKRKEGRRGRGPWVCATDLPSVGRVLVLHLLYFSFRMCDSYHLVFLPFPDQGLPRVSRTLSDPSDGGLKNKNLCSETTVRETMNVTLSKSCLCAPLILPWMKDPRSTLSLFQSIHFVHGVKGCVSTEGYLHIREGGKG